MAARVEQQQAQQNRDNDRSGYAKAVGKEKEHAASTSRGAIGSEA